MRQSAGLRLVHRKLHLHGRQRHGTHRAWRAAVWRRQHLGHLILGALARRYRPDRPPLERAARIRYALRGGRPSPLWAVPVAAWLGRVQGRRLQVGLATLRLPRGALGATVRRLLVR